CDKSLQSLTTIPDKYERALIKIQQLKKEQEDLKGKVELQSVEIAQLTPRLKSEQETRRLKDYIQLLQEARTQLHQEQRACNNTRRRAEKAERELEEVYERMESTSMTSAQTKQKSSKLEMQLLELRRIIEEKENIAEMAKVEN
ncbi:GRB10-interacting GYF protein 2-like, partial [Salvelinus fontinalis]|uniref:GRB10-interacting GYF protein 2-like n=1 Tax=Salvelinus fontinalis TaxID=8038 RepID=UPI002486AF9D